MLKWLTKTWRRLKKMPIDIGGVTFWPYPPPAPDINGLTRLWPRTGTLVSPYHIDVSNWPVAVDIGNVPGSTTAIAAMQTNDAPILNAPTAIAGTITGTRYYRVVAIAPTTPGGVEGVASNIVSIVLAGQAARLTWTRQVGATQGYRVFRFTSQADAQAGTN